MRRSWPQKLSATNLSWLQQQLDRQAAGTPPHSIELLRSDGDVPVFDDQILSAWRIWQWFSARVYARKTTTNNPTTQQQQPNIINKTREARSPDIFFSRQKKKKWKLKQSIIFLFNKGLTLVKR
ncbi:hypothetical protein SteCoe_31741 [Stentor coeruleus]|uniref:Uncharacterized protein n=1 Tax=Stentor coeruleus TaxID=5963 RepID=A0A1R2B0L3_9CILI|nr:hypothetical protein SteCoe_31741 [Stentor coeruleus]